MISPDLKNFTEPTNAISIFWNSQWLVFAYTKTPYEIFLLRLKFFNDFLRWSKIWRKSTEAEELVEAIIPAKIAHMTLLEAKIAHG